MDTRARRDLPARLEAVRQRFQAWRGKRKPRSRIPEPLWSSAVKLVSAYGLYRTARALRLDYYALKKRAERGPRANNNSPTAPTAVSKAEVVTPFLELVSPISTATECVVELENAAGAKMRVHLKGVASPDLATLSRSFWNHEP
jgi:hypothetical protein